MSTHIAGMGWVTPLGSSVPEVWSSLLRGEEAAPETVVNPGGGEGYQAMRVPASALHGLPAHARLRRASAISRFGALAGLAALSDARAKLGEIDSARLALIFAISNGGVIYTRRFYHDVVASGAGAASPLLFPETVFNAPASHLAAILGVTGPTYTLVGDGAVGLSAVDMAADLMTTKAVDYCLVVGAEEADWLLCDAYAKWRLLRPAAPIEPFANVPKGTILSEGAGAILLAREGPLRLKATHPGSVYNNRRQLAAAAEAILREIHASSATLIVVSANGTFIDAAERRAVERVMPKGQRYTAKPALGESVGPGGLWQVIVAAQALLTRVLPPILRAPASSVFDSTGASASSSSSREAIVLTLGLNQQVSALSLVT